MSRRGGYGEVGGHAAGGGSGGATEHCRVFRRPSSCQRATRPSSGVATSAAVLERSLLPHFVPCCRVRDGGLVDGPARLRAVISRMLDPTSGSQHASLSSRGHNQGGAVAGPNTTADPPTPRLDTAWMPSLRA